LCRQYLGYDFLKKHLNDISQTLVKRGQEEKKAYILDKNLAPGAKTNPKKIQNVLNKIQKRMKLENKKPFPQFIIDAIVTWYEVGIYLQLPEGNNYHMNEKRMPPAGKYMIKVKGKEKNTVGEKKTGVTRLDNRSTRSY
jgi:hypothetical protein